MDNLFRPVSILRPLITHCTPLETITACRPCAQASMGKKRKRSKQAAGDPAPAAATAASSSSAAAHPPSGSDDDEADEGPPAAEEVDTAIYVVRYLARRPELFEQRVFKGLRAALHPLVELQRQRYDPVDYAARTSAALRAGEWYHSNQGSRYRRALGTTLTAPPPNLLTPTLIRCRQVVRRAAGAGGPARLWRRRGEAGHAAALGARLCGGDA